MDRCLTLEYFLTPAVITGTIMASPMAITIRPKGIATHFMVVTVTTPRVTRHTRKPSRKDLRMPMASTSEPTARVTRVMTVDQAATHMPASVSDSPRSYDSHRVTVVIIRP